MPRERVNAMPQRPYDFAIRIISLAGEFVVKMDNVVRAMWIL